VKNSNEGKGKNVVVRRPTTTWGFHNSSKEVIS